ncbi:Putative inner membrane protein [Carnobacterium iners]|uniref:Putative inner membrane protein n=1 Tax=Carnobacterium iners TaxID=1073423 RepID=A0A1X7MVL3_9LACT|nr:DUF1819 family protein [Carnobacterium iners]SEL10156.1 Putative inner membrane protein [Carnobacterium iners]SMH28847.1 Putative inner membrane protein [Carnobacterium iners]
MEKKNQYRTTIKICPLFYQETKRINQLLLNNITKEEIIKKLNDQNHLQLTSAAQIKSVGSELLYRLSLLDKKIQEMIQKEDNQTSKTLVVYSIICADRLFQEFTRELYLDKLLTLYTEISKQEVIRFIERKAETNETVAKWQEYTYNRLARSFLQVLKEAGWIHEMRKSHYKIERPFISIEARNYLKEAGYGPAVEVVLGELL